MAKAIIRNGKYTIESLTQWDRNQELVIYGLSLSKAPEVHFANCDMARALARQSTMDSAGVVRVKIPNSLLQKAYKIKVNVCQYAGRTFEALYELVIPVKAKAKPLDYVLENDDEELYSFNYLENQIDGALKNLDAAEAALQEAKKDIKTAEGNYAAANKALQLAVEQANRATEQANYVFEHAEASVKDYEAAAAAYQNALVVVNGAGPAVVGMTGTLTDSAVLELEDYHTYTINAENVPKDKTLTLRIKQPDGANMRYCKVIIKIDGVPLNLSMPDVEVVDFNPSGIHYRIPAGSEFPAVLSTYCHYVIDIFDHYVTFQRFTVLGN